MTSDDRTDCDVPNLAELIASQLAQGRSVCFAPLRYHGYHTFRVEVNQGASLRAGKYVLIPHVEHEGLADPRFLHYLEERMQAADRAIAAVREVNGDAAHRDVVQQAPSGERA